ncbi:EscU/YscU/HrcU family type III secretion system export apparatus switch protein [uncultured Erythrobacter sp.]|uniref:EscU/YscU/HrcU family type III secretion system export apparatus switch protein n=1 Tax=uncultured Erythrobacter sp. TaxID=263913 RepID=UPI00261ABCD2|nr:EscU/YscU/HrcU family type III secretion system export apparatus switch protein [uncultured Erythrobacter sp.]
MAEETPGEKRFDPTPKRKADAAQKGDVLRSREVATAVAMAVGTAMLAIVGPWLFEGVKGVALASFQFEIDRTREFDPAILAMRAGTAVLPPILVIGITVTLITVSVQLLLGEGRFVLQNLKPKGQRINPLSGLKRIFGTQGMIELGKSILKLTLLGSVAGYWIYTTLDSLLGMGRSSLETQLAYAWEAAASLTFLLVIGLAVIAMVDYPIQAFQRNKRLKMSFEDLKNETKQAEGSPEMKSARRQRQRDLARGSFGKAMKDAQFVVVNPMHFSVAMTYDPELAPAPVVLAKGRGETAWAMREMAGEMGLPVLEYPSLARAVYFTTRPNQMVREELYIAIAALVAFVLSLKRGERPIMPQVDVPEDLRFDADGKPEKTA